MKLLIIRAIILLLTAAALTSCGSGDSPTGYGSISLSLVWKHDPAAAQGKVRQSAAPDVCADYGITQIYAYIRNSSSTIVAQGNWPCANHGATITGIPAGTVSIQVDGVVGANTDWRGQRNSITITANQDTNLSSSPIVMTYIGGHTSIPTVVGRNPAPGATGISIYTNITASFSEDMAISSINESTFTVKALASSVCGTVSYNTGSRMAACQPSTALTFGTVYTATLTTGVTDMAMIPLASAVTWTFTSDSGIPVPPAGVSALPSNGKVTLSWLVSNGATTYNIYSSTTQTVAVNPGNLVTSTSGTTYVHSAANDTKRYYVITAENVYGESSASSEVSATPGKYRYPAAIAGGYFHSMALKSDGTAWAWGSDQYGQLGDGGTNTDMPTPVQVSGLTNVMAIAAGSNHSMALKSDGTVWAWGWDVYGQLGDGGTNTDMPTPVLVSGLTNIMAIAAGMWHSMALKSDGTVWAWGSDSYGQLGDGGTNTNMPTPVQVSGLTNVMAIAAGGGHSMALKSDGTVWAWGYDFYGQLGDGGTNTDMPTPVQVSGLTNVMAIAAGNSHSMALKSDGTLWAWGRDNAGQLGDGGTNADMPTPVQVSGLTNVMAITAGFRHSMALKSDGTVWAWGYDSNGQLGDGGTNTDMPTPVQVSGLTNVMAIAAGSSHSMALKSDGTVWAWGSDFYGQLGDGGTNTAMSTPVQVAMYGSSDSSQAKKTTSTLGTYHSLMVKSDGTVWTWGRDNSGQLGNGNPLSDSSTPIQVSGLTNIVAAAAGNSHNIILKSDGTVWAWGADGNGQLGDDISYADKYAPVQVTGLSNVTKISSKTSHNLALMRDGTVWAWGSGNNGQLGNGNTVDQPTVVQVSSLSNVIDIAAGNSHSLALKGDGTVWAWGYNGNGQLGQGGAIPGTNQSTPVQVTGLANIIALAAGGQNFSLALRSDGTAWAWGADTFYTLGDNAAIADISTPAQVLGLTNIVAIAGGNIHSLALRSDGTIWSWGWDGNGQLGDDSALLQKATPVQVSQTSGLTSAVAITAGGMHSMAVRGDGTLFVWGSDANGQLGLSATIPGANQPTPVQVSGF